MVEMHEQEQRQLIEAMSNANDNDHHNIPRPKFGPSDGGAEPKTTGTQPNEACDVGLIS